MAETPDVPVRVRLALGDLLVAEDHVRGFLVHKPLGFHLEPPPPELSGRRRRRM